MLELSPKTRDIEPMLIQRYTIVCDAGPILNQHLVDVSRLLGFMSTRGKYSFSPVSQKVPAMPNGHAQAISSSFCTQNPPFWHGLEAHAETHDMNLLID